MRFTPEQFTPTEFDTAEDKARFANKLVRFVEAEFAPSHFPKWFYRRLMNTFGHIAHYNQGGFYSTWFSSPAHQLDWLEYIGKGGAYDMGGDPAFTHSDVERVVAEWVQRSGFIEKKRKEVAQELEDRERAELARLQHKYA